MSEPIINAIEDKKLHSKSAPQISLSIDIKKMLLAVLPLILVQILQRFAPIIDNHYIANLGKEALLIHNIQYSFINLGQYIGGATAVSCLIFWKRAEYANRQGGIFYMHIGLCFCVSFICMLIASYYSQNILNHFSVNPEYYSLALKYFNLGLFNMVLQALYLTLIGIVIAVNKEKLSLLFSITLLLFNILADSLIIHLFFSGEISPQKIESSMLAIIVSNIIFISIAISIIFYLLRNRIKQIHFFGFIEIMKIWVNELSGAFITAVYPIVYLFQLGLIDNGSLLITYQLLAQLTVVFCIPILATMQVSLREASAQQSILRKNGIPPWVLELAYFGLIPTEIFLLLFLIYPTFFIQLVFGYQIPTNHIPYIEIYLLASMIGQIGNMLTVAIRAKKKSHLVTICYFISDIIILLGITQLLFIAHIATPMTAGLVMLLYTLIYTGLNMYFTFWKKF